MKSLTLVSTGTLCLAIMSCSTAAAPPAGAAGSTASTGGTSSASGGQTGTNTSGGATTTGTGGQLASSGGSQDTGAGGSSAGSDGTTGGSSTASGGSAAVGGATSSGGSTAAGGSTGPGGATGTGGTTGTAGSAGSGTDLLSIVGAWDGALLQYPCGSGNPNYDCPEPAPCANATAATGAAVIKPAGGAATSWQIGGTVGTMYNVSLRILGVVETSWYHDGTRMAGNTTSVDVNTTDPLNTNAFPTKNLFQTGGTPLTFADTGNGFDYNQFELDVTPPGGGAPSVYFLNSVIPAENPHTSVKTQHLTFAIDENPTIKVPGGSTVSLTVRDSNCVEVQNCGTSNDNTCGTGSRSISLAGSVPAPPGSWTGKVTSGTGGNLNGQFVHFDITSVTVAQ